ASTSMLLYPTATFAMILSFGAASRIDPSIRSVRRQTSASLSARRPRSSPREIGSSPAYRSTVPAARSLSRTNEGSLRVTRTAAMGINLGMGRMGRTGGNGQDRRDGHEEPFQPFLPVQPFLPSGPQCPYDKQYPQ